MRRFKNSDDSVQFFCVYVYSDLRFLANVFVALTCLHNSAFFNLTDFAFFLITVYGISMLGKIKETTFYNGCYRKINIYTVKAPLTVQILIFC